MTNFEGITASPEMLAKCLVIGFFDGTWLTDNGIYVTEKEALQAEIDWLNSEADE